MCQVSGSLAIYQLFSFLQLHRIPACVASWAVPISIHLQSVLSRKEGSQRGHHMIGQHKIPALKYLTAHLDTGADISDILVENYSRKYIQNTGQSFVGIQSSFDDRVNCRS